MTGLQSAVSKVKQGLEFAAGIAAFNLLKQGSRA